MIGRCECVPGYAGELCQYDVNECESHPCLNGATCIDLPANYSCVCPPAYSGHHCQQRLYYIDFCVYNNMEEYSLSGVTTDYYPADPTMSVGGRATSTDAIFFQMYPDVYMGYMLFSA